MLNQTQLNILSHLEEHVCHMNYDIIPWLNEVMDAFPEFQYRGLAYRALKGEWQEGFKNLSWSIEAGGALEACESDYEDVYLYCGEITGFDLDLLVHELSKSGFEFSPRLKAYVEREREILCFNYKNLELVSVQKGN